MDENPTLLDISTAKGDFRKARSQANLRELFRQLSGEPRNLLSYDEVRTQLRLQSGVDLGIRDIPLEQIKGSVGRYTDFTRDFLPRSEVSPDRWARIRVMASGLVGLPPIEVYKIGEVYFVKDGNHRVSVARQFDASYIQAYVTEITTRVPLSPDDQPDDLILKAEYADFLGKTRLDELRPEANLIVSLPGKYPTLLEHIEVHRYFMGMDLQRDIPYEEAVDHWYDAVYLPIAQLIQDLGLLREFPDRTEADLYLWLANHRAHLEEGLGWNIQPEYAALDLKTEKSKGLISRLIDIVTPQPLAAGPPTGVWRTTTQSARREDCIFIETLVPVNGLEEGWCALEQALVLAKQENSVLHGLHVVADEDSLTHDETLAVKQKFDKRCAETGVAGELTLAKGHTVTQICKNAAWSDLVVVNMAHPPLTPVVEKLASGFRQMIQRCPRPILATPNTISEMQNALVAFDGSPKAREALFIATYLAENWQIQITILSVQDSSGLAERAIDEAKAYLDKHKITSAAFMVEEGPAAETILRAGETRGVDLYIMGGYSHNPVLEMVMGSSVNQVLRESKQPVFICR